MQLIMTDKKTYTGDLDEKLAGKLYYINAECRNCGFKGLVGIVKGSVVMNSECPKCECLTLERTAQINY